jgi:spermidine synthase
MSTFPNMADLIPPSSLGVATIEHYEVTKMDAMMATIRGMYTETGKVAILKVNGATFMFDTQHERRSNSQIVWEAKGDVLIAGLGLGMILHPILANDKVSSVTMIEKYQDVIDLIRPTLPFSSKLTLVCADIFKWKPQPKVKWDVIYFDIWADMCTDHLKEIAQLHQRFKFYKRKGGWMDSWGRDEMKDHLRRYGW